MKQHISFDLEFLTNTFPGKLVVIEGIDGSGKSSQVRHVVEALKKEGFDAVSTKEPTNSIIGSFIRHEILSGKTVISPIALQYLFNADRAMHMEHIEKMLTEGKTVVMDRYFWSSVAYAIADLDQVGDYYLTAFSVLSFYNRFLLPDITIYLDLPVGVAFERIEERRKLQEIYDTEEKMKKVTQGYAFLREKFPQQFNVVNANRPMEEVTADIVSLIKSRLFN